jgi:hypothetical protein
VVAQAVSPADFQILRHFSAACFSRPRGAKVPVIAACGDTEAPAAVWARKNRRAAIEGLKARGHHRGSSTRSAWQSPGVVKCPDEDRRIQGDLHWWVRYRVGCSACVAQDFLGFIDRGQRQVSIHLGEQPPKFETSRRRCSETAAGSKACTLIDSSPQAGGPAAVSAADKSLA